MWYHKQPYGYFYDNYTRWDMAIMILIMLTQCTVYIYTHIFIYIYIYIYIYILHSYANQSDEYRYLSSIKWIYLVRLASYWTTVYTGIYDFVIEYSSIIRPATISGMTNTVYKKFHLCHQFFAHLSNGLPPRDLFWLHMWRICSRKEIYCQRLSL